MSAKKDKSKDRSYEGSSDIKVENPDMIICRCEEITLKEIVQAIASGASTVNEVKRMTRAGMGLCQGRSCGRLVRRLLAERTGKKLNQVMPGTARPPVRPMSLGCLASLEEE
jgi:NAD(P)H-nitrite reductase large subunit